MCGILGEFNTKVKNKETPNANQFIINQFENQHSRGQKGFGIIRIDEKKNVEIDRACETTKFLMDLYMKESKMIIAHHRTPTSTDNLIDQTHPISVSNKLLDYDYLVIHNGMISNTEELYKKHKELGFIYTTEMYEYGYQNSIKTKWNDSESLAIELALFIEKKVSAIGIDNNAAFIVLQIEKNGKAKTVFFGRNGEYADLIMFKTKGKLQISSEGAGDEVEVNKLFSFNIKDKKMTLSERVIEFKKKEIPVIPTEIKLEVTKEAEKEVINKGNQTKTKTIIVKKRGWYDGELAEYDPTEASLTPEIVKGYVEEQSAIFKELILTEDSNAITHLIDDALDAEVEKIADVISNYKNSLLENKFEYGEEVNYSSQIYRIIRTMKELTNIAEQDYDEKLDMEEELETYNDSYAKDGWDGRTYEKRSQETTEYDVINRPIGFISE